MTRHAAAWGAFVLLLAFVPACGLIDEGPPANRCESDAECTSGTCDVVRQMCVGTVPTTFQIALEVAPIEDAYGTATTVQPIAFDAFPLDGPMDAHDITLPNVIPTQGRVRDQETGSLVTAEIELTLISPIPGAGSTTLVAESSDSERVAEDGYVYNFGAQLIPNRDYNVVVQPTGEWRTTRPPMRFEVPYQSPESGIARFDFLEYPELCVDPALADAPCLATIEGWVRDGADLPQDGYVVKVVSRDTGATISSRYITGSDPEAEVGFFQVVFHVDDWRNTEGWFLQIAPSADRVANEGPAPTFSVAPTALLEIAGMVTVLVPDHEGLGLTYSGIVETEDMRPLAEAAIRFTSTDIVDPTTGIVGSYTTTVFTDDRGAFTDVRLLGTDEGVEEPPTYEVVITPSQNDEGLGVLREEHRLGATAGPQLFTVPRRAHFGGTVQTVDGLRMLDARVVSRPRGGNLDGTLEQVAFFARSSSTTTDRDGIFDLPLDIGFYDVVFEPPAGTNFPWRIERDVAIGGSVAPTDVYDLEHPVPITGEVTWSIEDTAGERVPVVEGEVRAYAIVEDETGTRAFQIGRATTDASGRYTLLIPPSF